ncbi:MAG TPA: SCO family protein [Candidatus Binataceae bacterium]|nr:SCO family protein [Candidatus Binataceae bacterium]
MHSVRVPTPIGGSRVMTLLIALVIAFTSATWREQVGYAAETGGFPVLNAPDCLPDITLVDMHGRKVTLSSLKGKPVLFDFFYTTCPGPCLMLTAQMRRVAKQLGPALGTKARFVSITVDPEHDHPEQLLKYANAHDAEMNGWLFLTGTPKLVDKVMARFHVVRQREPDGTIDHVLEFFLVDAKGRAMLQYLASKADPRRVASDVEQAAEGKDVTASAGAGAAAASKP